MDSDLIFCVLVGLEYDTPSGCTGIPRATVERAMTLADLGPSR